MAVDDAGGLVCASSGEIGFRNIGSPYAARAGTLLGFMYILVFDQCFVRSPDIDSNK